MKKAIFISIFFCILWMIFNACGTDSTAAANEPFSDCQYGAPKPVFKTDLPKIIAHSFQLNNQAAVEKVRFDGDIILELIQSGCEKPKQEFQFTIPTNTTSFSDQDWMASTIDMFGLMGNLSPDLQPFLLWQGALKERLKELKLGLAIELEPSFFVKIDKIAGEDTGLLLVTLFQQ